MKILSVKQKNRIKELKERNKTINSVLQERMTTDGFDIPINLVLESRFNVLTIIGINLEGELEYVKKYQEDFPLNYYDIKSRRLDSIKGQINELNNVGDLLKKFHSMGKELNIDMSI